MGFPLWDLVIEAWHSSTKKALRNPLCDKHSRKHTNNQTKFPIKRNDRKLINVDNAANAQSSRSGAMLYFFEDNEAVIKIIIKGRSPTMRYVSRTHRVALDWLFHRINLDPKFRIKYIDTKHQVADILTKGNCTRDEWNHLLRMFNISNHSSVCCLQTFNSASCPRTMSKRWLEGAEEEERVMAKSKPKPMMNLVSETVERSPTALISSASKSPGTLRARSQNLGLIAGTGRSAAEDSNENAASSYQA